MSGYFDIKYFKRKNVRGSFPLLSFLSDYQRSYLLELLVDLLIDFPKRYLWDEDYL